MKEVGSAIIKRRKELGLTQAELAQEAGITANALSSIERGASIPSSTTYDKIFGALGVRPVVVLIDMNIDFKGAVEALSKLSEAVTTTCDFFNSHPFPVLGREKVELR